MAMDYSRLKDILQANNTTLYKLSAEKVIGNATRSKLLGQQPGGIDTRTIEALCKRLNCQPGDFMTKNNPITSITKPAEENRLPGGLCCVLPRRAVCCRYCSSGSHSTCTPRAISSRARRKSPSWSSPFTQAA